MPGHTMTMPCQVTLAMSGHAVPQNAMDAQTRTLEMACATLFCLFKRKRASIHNNAYNIAYNSRHCLELKTVLPN